MQDISTVFLHDVDVRMAVVSYKDHVDRAHIRFLNFTPSADRVRAFLDTLVASGGSDGPEDILGGLQQALNASWSHSTRCIVHITDAPPHGRTLHDLSDWEDMYPNPGSEPHRLTHGAILTRMIRQNINYALFRINNSTDRMAYTFFKAYAALSPDCRLHESNRYAADARRFLAESCNAGFQGWTLSARQARNAPLLHEINLGTSYHALRHLVVKVLTTSATQSAIFFVHRDEARPNKRRRTHLPAVGDVDEEDDTGVVLDTAPPKWNTPGWLNEVLECEAFSTDVIADGKSKLDGMMDHDDNITITITTTDLTVHKRNLPFAQGGLRVASYARSAACRNKLVIKSVKRNGRSLAHMLDEMRCQALCKAFALEFNAMLAGKYSLDFAAVTCLKPKTQSAQTSEYLSLEPLINGKYVKYNSNKGYVNNDYPQRSLFRAAQAFSHFTFERSQGRFMVCDLQGVRHVLTDSSVHTRDPNRFACIGTNLHTEGFKFFFSTHECNDICEQLGLKSTAAMLTTNRYQFRTKWPTNIAVSNMRVVCSNKLCSKIVRISLAQKSDEFPGYHWCSNCWTELHVSMEKVLCTAPGPPHHFRRCRFFYEAQGQVLPRLCPKHRDGDGGGGTAAVDTLTITTVRATETSKCWFDVGCTIMECPFLHPIPPCDDGSACIKVNCAFRHPNIVCRFMANCVNAACPYRHPGLRLRQANTTAFNRRWRELHPLECCYGPECVNVDCTFQHPVAICVLGSGCTARRCPLRHPSTAIDYRFGSECLNIKCLFKHPLLEPVVAAA